MSRGNARRRIVRDDRDRQRRLDWLRRAVETYGWRLHADRESGATLDMCAFDPGDESAVIRLWERCGLTQSWRV